MKDASVMQIADGVPEQAHSTPSHAKQAQEKTGENRLESERHKRNARNYPSHRDCVLQIPKSRRAPDGERIEEKIGTDDHCQCPNGEPSLELYHAKGPRQNRIWRQQVLADRKHLGEHSEDNRLIAADDGEAREKKGVNIEVNSADSYPRQSNRVSGYTQNNQRQPRNQKKPARTVEEEKAEGTPPVPKCPQVRRVGESSVRIQGDRDLCDPRAVETALDDHLGRELHPDAALSQTCIEFLRESAEAAINIVDLNVEPMTREG